MKDKELVCTLTAADYQDREAAWLKLADYIRSSAAIPGGIAVTFDPVPGLRDSLAELVRLEAECCGWMAFALSDSPDGVRMSITASGEDGGRGVRATFAPLLRGVA